MVFHQISTDQLAHDTTREKGLRQDLCTYTLMPDGSHTLSGGSHHR